MPRRGGVPKREVLPDPIYNSTVVGENEYSCVTVQFGGSFWAENCKFTSVGNQNYNGGLLLC